MKSYLCNEVHYNSSTGPFIYKSFTILPNTSLSNNKNLFLAKIKTAIPTQDTIISRHNPSKFEGKQKIVPGFYSLMDMLQVTEHLLTADIRAFRYDGKKRLIGPL
jgi:hypothetical protein